MSLILVHAKPQVEVKTFGSMMPPDERGQELVHIGAFMDPIVSIPMDDFLAMVNYVLTNTNLSGEDDPRLAFIESVKLLY